MAKVIAIAGKGGTGKTTLAALVVRALIKKGIKPVLAVDADPNSTLPERLGMTLDTTVGDLREDTLGEEFRETTDVPKAQRLEFALQQAIGEGMGVDLLVMGRQEGPGCYCSVNNLLREMLKKINRAYERVVVDNEAGMEHISRRTDGRVDALLVTSDPTPTALRAAGRINDLSKKLRLKISSRGLVVMRSPAEPDDRMTKAAEKTGLETLGMVPECNLITEFSYDDRSLLELPDDCKAAAAVEKLVDKLEL